MKRKSRVFFCDFETTVYENQTFTEVWSSACVEIGQEKPMVFHSIGEQFEFFKSLKSHIIAYWHNLKFDGHFWLSYLFTTDLKQAIIQTGENELDQTFLTQKDMPNNSFAYSISSMGQWYRILIKVQNKIIEIRDSLKLLPFTLKSIGKSFQTKHQKIEMEYKGFRYAGCEITDEELEYIENDVLVLKEAMEIMYREGHTSLTIGSCCLQEYKRMIGRPMYKEYHPNLYEIPIDGNIYTQNNAGEYIRQSYKGGWCYLVPEKKNTLYKNGITVDVNSLYPSMMSSESGNVFPVGEPTFWHGNYIPDEAIGADKYFFIRVKTRFKIKDGKLPFIQVKNNLLYRSTEMLTTSDVKSKTTGEYHSHYINIQGELTKAFLTLTLTQTDYKLFLEHYDTYDLEIISGCWFYATIGIFDEYIEKYKQIKLNSKGAVRELAKLFLNNLYGKMASSKNSSFKVAYIKEDGSLGFYTVTENDKEPGYIAIGSAITSYARNFTIRTAQQNYYGPNKPGFIYADTDSIHCDISEEELKGVRLHDKNFCCWKVESKWEIGWFVRAKTYIEASKNNGGINYDIKCAGMPAKCKDLFRRSLEEDFNNIPESYSKEDLDFIKTKRQITDFAIGLKVPGKLLPRRIRGGVVLTDTTFEMRRMYGD